MLIPYSDVIGLAVHLREYYLASSKNFSTGWKNKNGEGTGECIIQILEEKIFL